MHNISMMVYFYLIFINAFDVLHKCKDIYIEKRTKLEDASILHPKRQNPASQRDPDRIPADHHFP